MRKQMKFVLNWDQFYLLLTSAKYIRSVWQQQYLAMAIALNQNKQHHPLQQPSYSDSVTTRAFFSSHQHK